MNQHGSRIPTWAIMNTALLFGPIALGLGAFRIWFIPNPELRVSALVSLVVYYIAVIQICKRTSRAKIWQSYKRTNPKWFDHLKLTLGFIMFSYMAFFGFYAVGPAIATDLLGTKAGKELTIASVSAVYRTGCRYEIRFSGVSPPMGGGFCVRAGQLDARWVKGSKVTLYGHESVLGFRFTQIER